jgi:hypothetical protein
LLLILERFSHSVSNGTFIERLIGLNGHFDFISDSNQKESSFGTVDGDFTDEFVKGLRVELFSDGANTRFTHLTLL